MAGIRGRDTRPEILVRSWLHRHGLRFRLHKAGLPGRPDLVLARYRTVIFVHGCFWHRHPRCRYATTPSTNRAFWRRKFEQNVARDTRQRRELGSLGWRVLVIWECQVQAKGVLARLERRIRR
jgi:DNA mismatch endonuclease (patch repair protein)